MADVTCRGCGRQLSPAARWCPDCGTALGETVKCLACGSDIPKGPGRGCPYCGANQVGAYGSHGVGACLVAGVLFLLSIFLLGGFSCRAFESRKQQEDRKRKADEENRRWLDGPRPRR